ncbi:hypothetical protein M6B38_262350 [Iris pallida]|uniref:Uncharacterized protein n=1 Tax=Iris pallida TaxID=29817 RepID=A0AAX6ICZ2_IRIPA|nr:hypothetical protein M6B38_262350 [Iris pallida]
MMKPFSFFLLAVLASMLVSSACSRHNSILVEKKGYRRLLSSPMGSRQLRQATDSAEMDDVSAQPTGSGYQGAGTDSHHTIDLETWNRQHPKPPY